MIARFASLRKHPTVFRHVTGLTVPAFDALAADVVPAVEAAHRKSLDRPDRRRAIGAGGAFGLSTADQTLLAVVWLRQYPTQEVLGFLFGVSDSTALRAVRRCLPILEAAGRDRPPEDRKYNRAFSRRRIIVDHTIGRLRRFRSVSHVNRHRRKGHAARVRAVAGLVNRMLPTTTD